MDEKIDQFYEEKVSLTLNFYAVSSLSLKNLFFLCEFHLCLSVFICGSFCLCSSVADIAVRFPPYRLRRHRCRGDRWPRPGRRRHQEYGASAARRARRRGRDRPARGQPLWSAPLRGAWP